MHPIEYTPFINKLLEKLEKFFIAQFSFIFLFNINFNCDCNNF